MLGRQKPFMKESLNWYKIASITAEIHQEAGIKEWLGTALLSALIAVLSGTPVAEAAQKHKVPPSHLQSAMQNSQVVSKVRSIMDQDADTVNPRLPNSVMFTPDNVNANQPQVNQPAKTETKPVKKELTQDQQKVVDYLARTLWAEARGEGSTGLKAVLSVILNRAKNDPNKITSVLRQPHQFESWNNGVPSKGSGDLWNYIVGISNQAVNGSFSPTVPYVSFFNPKKAQPSWAYQNGKLVEPHVQIGNHVFLNPKPAKPKNLKVKPSKHR
jgi:spore germination cell wall hydrolase CwlJ-like protein